MLIDTGTEKVCVNRRTAEKLIEFYKSIGYDAKMVHRPENVKHFEGANGSFSTKGEIYISGHCKGKIFRGWANILPNLKKDI